VDHSDEDTTITALLDAAVAHVSDYCNRHFTVSTQAIFYLERWRPASLAFGPVSNISSVNYYDTAGVYQTLSSDKYYTEERKDGPWRIYFHDVPDLEEYNAQPVRITVTCGLAATSNVKHAVRMLVAHWYENRRAVVTGAVPVEVPMAVTAILNSERIIDLRQ